LSLVHNETKPDHTLSGNIKADECEDQRESP